MEVWVKIVTQLFMARKNRIDTMFSLDHSMRLPAITYFEKSRLSCSPARRWPRAMSAAAFLAAICIMSLPVSGAHAAMRQQGEAAVCYYDGKSYSEGAKITLQDGTVQTCGSDGKWFRKKPKGGIFQQAPTGGLKTTP